MLSLLISIGIFVLVLSFLVIIHELGHFFVARWAGITVKEFGIGYPPKAVKLFSWLGSDFTLNWIPFGGFVRMDGEEDEPDSRFKQAQKGQFYAAPVAKRLLVILAGALTNFVFGILAFAVIFSWVGIPQELPEARVGFVAENSPARQADIPTGVNILGFKQNDQLTSTPTSAAVIKYVTDHLGQDVIVVTSGPCESRTCQEIVQEYPVRLRTKEETPANQGSLGVAFDNLIFVHYPWYEKPWRSVVYGLEESLSLGKEILSALSKLGADLFTRGQVSTDLAGPVGIVHQAHSAGILQQGFIMVLSFAAMLSINLAIMNVLPISPLDGGKAVFTVLELFVARKHLYKVEYWLSYSGYLLLLLLIVFVTIRDVVRIFT